MLTHTITFFNVNSDRRLNPKTTIGEAFGHLHPDQRVKIFRKKILQRASPDDILFLFEISPDMLVKLIFFAREDDFTYHVAPYNKSKGAFTFLILSKNP